MTPAKTTAALLLAGLLAGGAYAQTATATSDVPVAAGEASTVTHGVPNMATSNAPRHAAPVTSATGEPVYSAASPDTAVMGAPADARVVPWSGATETSNIPTRAGEVSTMTNGVPNMSTHNPVVHDSRLVVPPQQTVERVPQRAGEMSTMVGGRPNGNPDDPLLN
ncbi:hypothetical protein PE066_11100 [Ramlibacter tataouinensis]|uniref:hypothetical protein n=1 Tax=Ramlibacter tataouinensis TaxID=94132 RepID=UPI0022F3C766|nr:hypothetical protein [Ramlibacter tataouinensis]WBY00031.1 hypothetical protein PE066_11100 [Ramlibacter tataouinensis]